jgi:hypothetical protein
MMSVISSRHLFGFVRRYPPALYRTIGIVVLTSQLEPQVLIVLHGVIHVIWFSKMRFKPDDSRCPLAAYGVLPGGAALHVFAFPAEGDG